MNLSKKTPHQKQVTTMIKMLSLKGKSLTKQQKATILSTTIKTTLTDGYKKWDEFERYNRNQHILQSAREIYDINDYPMDMSKTNIP